MNGLEKFISTEISRFNDIEETVSNVVHRLTVDT